MSQKSAQILNEFIQSRGLKKIDFAKMTYISRFTLYKYLKGAPIHPLKARSIEENIQEKFRVFIPAEALLE